MKRIPKQKRSLMKYEALLRAALIEFAENGYTQSTSKSIAERAGVATGSFYQYFDDKNDILYQLVRNRYEGLQARFFELAVAAPEAFSDLDDMRDSLAKGLTLLISFYEDMSGFHSVIHHRRHIDPQLDEIIQGFDQIFDERLRAFVEHFKPDRIEVGTFVVKSIAEGLVHAFVFDRPKNISRSALITEGVEAILNYVTTQSGQ